MLAEGPQPRSTAASLACEMWGCGGGWRKAGGSEHVSAKPLRSRTKQSAARCADSPLVRSAGADADDGADGSEDASPEDGDGDGSEDEPPSGIRRKTGHGTTGKPGKRLTLEDLQAHFGVSLQARRVQGLLWPLRARVRAESSRAGPSFHRIANLT